MIIIYLFFIALIAYAIRLYMRQDKDIKPWEWVKEEEKEEEKDSVSFSACHQNYPPNFDFWE